MNEPVKCNNCDVDCIWVFDETRSKNRLWSGRDWHKCDPKNTTIVNPKKINWFCMGCMEIIDIANHPCIHYQKLGKSERSIVRMEAVKKKT